MSTVSWFPNDGDAVAGFDQVHAAALKHLRDCDSFVLVIGNVDDTAIYGVRMQAVAGVQTPFAPHFLAQVLSLVARLPVDAMDDMLRHVRGDE